MRKMNSDTTPGTLKDKVGGVRAKKYWEEKKKGRGVLKHGWGRQRQYY